MNSFARWLMGAGVVAVGLLGTVFAGCDPEDGGATETGLDGGLDGADGADVFSSTPDVETCHVDCFGFLFCKPGFGDAGPQIYQELFAPVPCSKVPSGAHQTICRDRSSNYDLSCGDGVCSNWVTDPRYGRCEPSGELGRYENARMERLRCTTLPAEGSACQQERDCHPMVDVVDGNLRCTEGRCVAVPRPPAKTLEVCPEPNAFGCTTVCGTAYQTQRCLFDEACPEGMDCARGFRDSSCSGICLPRAFGRNLDAPICP
jgi:hypothetical protein